MVAPDDWSVAWWRGRCVAARARRPVHHELVATGVQAARRSYR
jgi:hypothetical protein